MKIEKKHLTYTIIIGLSCILMFVFGAGLAVFSIQAQQNLLNPFYKTENFQSIVEDDESEFGNLFNDVMIYQVSPQQAKPRETITIKGQGFENTNTVVVGNTVLRNVVSKDAFTIVLEGNKFPIGTHKVSVSNKKGSSADNPVKSVIKITNYPKQVPEIYSISDTSVSLNDKITVYGKNFSSVGNEIYSIFGNIKNVSSSKRGTEISFSPSSLEKFKDTSWQKGLPKGTIVPVGIYIITDEGIISPIVNIEVTL